MDTRSRAERARQAADVLRQQITRGVFADGLLPDERALGAGSAPRATRCGKRFPSCGRKG